MNEKKKRLTKYILNASTKKDENKKKSNKKNLIEWKRKE